MDMFVIMIIIIIVIYTSSAQTVKNVKCCLAII